tara:strand:+ start:342 stop:1259 length:918 start_codon:yes stop_codon:yes gene_type:complete
MNLNKVNQNLIKKLIISGPALISNFDKLIFIHLPRTGGKSIKTAFFSKYSSSFLYNLEYRVIFKILKKSYSDAHSSLEEIKDKIHINKIKKYDKFSIVRDPFSRLISIYKHIIYVHTSELSYSQSQNAISDLVTPKNFIDNIKKKSLNHFLPCSHHKLFAHHNNEFFFPDHIFNWKNISSCHQYLQHKYNFPNFIRTSSTQINEIFPTFREPSSKKGINPFIDKFIHDNISKFDELKSEINNLWSEEISILNTSKLNLKGEINLDKNRFRDFLNQKSDHELKNLSYQKDSSFFDKNIISKNYYSS